MGCAAAAPSGPAPALGPPPFPPTAVASAAPPYRRKWQLYRRALPGLNSAAVGLIVASVFQLTLNAYSTSPFPITSICIGIIAFAATDVLVVPAPLVVVGGGVLGVIGWAAHMK